MSISPEPEEPKLTLDDIDAGVQNVAGVEHKGKLDWLEEHKAEEARLRNEMAKAHIEGVNAGREMRKVYASRILRYLEWYSAIVGLIIIASGFGFTTFLLPVEIEASLVGALRWPPSASSDSSHVGSSDRRLRLEIRTEARAARSPAISASRKKA